MSLSSSPNPSVFPGGQGSVWVFCGKPLGSFPHSAAVKPILPMCTMAGQAVVVPGTLFMPLHFTALGCNR